MSTVSPSRVTPSRRTGAAVAFRMIPAVATRPTAAVSLPIIRASVRVSSLFAMLSALDSRSKSLTPPFGLTYRLGHLPLLDERQRIVHILRKDDRFLINRLHTAVEELVAHSDGVGLLVRRLQHGDEAGTIPNDSL